MRERKNVDLGGRAIGRTQEEREEGILIRIYRMKKGGVCACVCVWNTVSIAARGSRCRTLQLLRQHHVCLDAVRLPAMMAMD